MNPLYERVLSTISVEIENGVSLPIFYKGDPLPINRNVIFRSEVNQNDAIFHIVLGENVMMRDNNSIGIYKFSCITPIKKRGPRIELQISLDKNLNLIVKAKELFTSHIEQLVEVNVKDLSSPRVITPMSSIKENDLPSIGGINLSAYKNKKYDPDITLTALITPNELIEGTTRKYHYQRNNICSNCNGLGTKPGSAPPTFCNKCKGSGEISEKERTFFSQKTKTYICPDCNGRGTLISSPCDICSGNGIIVEEIDLEVPIPPKLSIDSVIRLAGSGSIRQNYNVFGNVYIYLQIIPPSNS